MADGKRIMKNTMFLYIRMLLVMGVTLFTSRVILDKLGIDDYGLYNVVGGVVGMLSFLTGTLSIGTSRFITFELGTGNTDKLTRTFSTAFYTHFILGVIIFLFMETVGLWFLYNKLVIPEPRFYACLWVFQISILTTFVSVTQVPYTSVIMAHERMGVYAYVSIFEVMAKLAVCYLISYSSFDRLIYYAVLIAVVQVIVASIYRIYCVRKFKESLLSKIFDKSIFRKMLGFSGWNIMANLSETFNQQGVLIMLNLFFTPAVVAAQAISVQVSNALMQFVNNFRTAINPQVIKLYASGQKEESKKLTLRTMVYSFDLILLLGFPAILIMDYLMHLWLVEVPDYAVLFTQWVIVRRLIGTFSASFYIPMMAANKMEVNSVSALVLCLLEFLILYILFMLGFGPLWLQYVGLANVFIFSFIVKPYVLCKDIGYTAMEIIRGVMICLKVSFFSLLFTLPVFVVYDGNDFIHSIVKAVASVVAVAVSSFVFMDKETKTKLFNLLKSKLR